MRVATLALTAAAILASRFNPIMAARNSKPEKDTKERIDAVRYHGDGKFTFKIEKGKKAAAIDSYKENRLVYTQINPKSPDQSCKNGDQTCHTSTTDLTSIEKEEETKFNSPFPKKASSPESRRKKGSTG